MLPKSTILKQNVVHKGERAMRIRLALANDINTKQLEQVLADTFPIKQIEKKKTNLWYIHLPAEYQWTKKDADVLEILSQSFLVSWNQLDW
jgi:hypothetical protein